MKPTDTNPANFTPTSPNLPESTTQKPSWTIIALIGDHVNGLGDNIIALDMLLALKRVYGCHLVVFAREVLQELLSGLDFVDELHLLEGDLTNPINKSRIDACHARYLITGSCKKWQLRFLLSTNVKTIITRMKLATLLSPRIRSVGIFERSITHRECGLLFARAVDRRCFDRVIDSVDYRACMVIDPARSSAAQQKGTQNEQEQRQRQRHIRGFLRESLGRLGRSDLLGDELLSQQLESKIAYTRAHRRLVESGRSRKMRRLTLANAVLESSVLESRAKDSMAGESSLDSAPSALSVGGTSTPLYLVMVNPFSVTTTHSMPLRLWLTLIDRISTLPNCVPVICTYDKVHEPFMAALHAYESGLDSRDVYPAAPESTGLDSSTLDSRESKSARQSLHDRCIIYHNTSSLLTLATLVAHMSVVVTPFTGLLYLAANLYTPTIEICAKDTILRWRAQDKRHCFLPSPTATLTDKEALQVIDDTISTLRAMLKL